MSACIDDHHAVYGVEPICRVRPIAPSTYHAHVARRVDPAKASPRTRRDAELRRQIRQVFAENFGVYGVRQVWRQLGREGRTLHGGAADARDGAARDCPGTNKAHHGQ